jgi:zinc/manganese transport system permease protein
MSALVNWFAEPWSYPFMQRGLMSALLLSISGGLLGSVLVLRRMALMGDALSHSLLPGLAVAWFFLGRSPWALLIGALLAGLLTALASAMISRLTRLKEDTAFGAFFLIAYAGGIALVSQAGTRVDLLHFLFGHILGVSPADLVLAATATGLTVAAFAVFRRGIVLEVFDPVFARAAGLGGGWVHGGFLALAVLNLVSALQAMGVILALGLFLLPAATAYLWCDRFGPMLMLATGVGMVGSTIGMMASYHTELASGPAIVLSLGVIFFASAVLSPRYGLIAAAGHVRRQRRTLTHTIE